MKINLLDTDDALIVYCVHDVCRDAKINLIKRIKNQESIELMHCVYIVHRICTHLIFVTGATGIPV